MFFCNMFDEFIDIALISTTKSTLKSSFSHIEEIHEKCSNIVLTSYSDSIGVHHWTREQVYSIVPHDCDVNDA